MKCSIITIHHIHNFGSIFQAYALYRFLSNNGYNVEIINYQPSYYKFGRNRIKTTIANILNFKYLIKRNHKFEKFIKQYEHLSDIRFSNIEELEKYYYGSNNIFIVGGDQLWNTYHPCGKDKSYKLTFVQTDKKVAYGTSMGRVDYSDVELQQLADDIKDFYRIMLREQSTVDLLKRWTQVPISHVIDPVGLLDLSDFEKLAIAPSISGAYAVMYLADSSLLLDEAIRILSNELGLKIVHICGFRKKCYCDYLEKDIGPQEILGYIINADFVLSASFHATMFSLLFNKQFASILPCEKTNTRITDILEYVGLQNRIISSETDLYRLKESIDFSESNAILKKFTETSKEYLLSSLENLLEK